MQLSTQANNKFDFALSVESKSNKVPFLTVQEKERARAELDAKARDIERLTAEVTHRDSLLSQVSRYYVVGILHMSCGKRKARRHTGTRSYLRF